MSHIANRYAKAITSANLKVQARSVGDADVIIATGWCAHPKRKLDRQRRDVNGVSLASLLQRLRIEFDRVDRKSVVIKAPDRRFVGPPTQKDCDMRHSSETAVASAYVHLRALYPTKLALRNFVAAKAERDHIQLNPLQLLQVADRALDHFLDPVCPSCQGVKFEPVPGTGRLSSNECITCKGTGFRAFGEGVHLETVLLERVLEEMFRKLMKLDRMRGHYLR